MKIKDIPKIRDFFLIYPLQTPKKQKIFELWSEIVSIVEQRCHLTKDGLLRCAELRDQMASIQYTKGKLKWSAKDIKKVVDSAGRRGHYNYYTAKELSFLKENYGKMPTTEIAMRLKRSAYSIRWHARQLGVTRHKHTE